MITMVWNSLHVGDRVLVHDSAASAHGGAVGAGTYPLHAGTVAIVDGSAPDHGIGIAVGDDPAHAEVRWPSRLRVHLDPRDVHEACWWCGQAAGS